VNLPSQSYGRKGRALLRVAGTKTGENRFVRAMYRASSVTLQNTGRILHVLWLEVTGLFFLVLAFVCGASGLREHHRQLAGTGSAGKMLLAWALAVMFGYFGVSSMFHSRKKR
jgi:4-amino-4-deoxy-L-arabinose transferase-like glycosyltransferase